MRRLLYLMRHGESEVNAADPPMVGGRSRWAELTALGVDQSRRLGRWLGEQNVPVDRIVSSTAVRAQQTARYALDELGIPLRRLETFPVLEEMAHGEWENRLRAETYVPEVVAQMEAENWNFHAPGGESLDDVWRRTSDWVQREVLEKDNEHTWVFCHGMVIKGLLAGFLNHDRQVAWRVWIDNASLTLLAHENDAWTELSRNVLPPV